MTDVEATAPEIVRVPPKQIRTTGSIGCWVIALLISLSPLLLGFEKIKPGDEWAIVVIVTFFVSFGAFLALLPGYAARQALRARREFSRNFPDSTTAPLATRIDELRYFGLRGLARRLRKNTLMPVDRPLVICLGWVQLPSSGEYRFEPQIIRPGDFIQRDLKYALIAALLAFAGLYLLVGRLALLPIGIFAAAALPLIVSDVFRSTRYIRFAPGCIDILYYNYFRARPKLRRFPMQPGTIVILHGAAAPPARWSRDRRIDKTGLSAVIICREDSMEHIRFPLAKEHPELRRRFLEALLSTAPTPAMSDTELTA